MRALERILYVDDEPDIRHVARIALEKVGGLTIHLCGSGREALDAIDAFRPDMVLLDVMMPGMDGPTTLGRLRGLPDWSGVPVAFLTAKTMPAEIARFLDLGVAAVITKPFQPMELAARLRAIWVALEG